jgi:hypothetical protein
MSIPSLIDDIPTEPLSDLEDKKLTQHIDEVRKLLNKYNKETNDDPLVVIENDKKIRILLSEAIIELKNNQNDLHILNDTFYTQFNNFSNLHKGIKPYAYQDCKTSSEIFDKLSKEFEYYNNKTEQLIFLSESVEKNITTMRRLYESIIRNVYDYV